MKLDEIHNLSKEDVINLLLICRKGMRFQDGFWFMNVEDRWGIDKAVEIDADIWSRFGKYEAQLILKRFQLKERGISRIIKAISYATSWLFFDYSIERVSENEALFKVNNCLAQTGRLKVGRNIFNCRKVEEGYLKNFTRIIDPKIKVECNFSPIEKSFKDLWCSWRFYIDNL